MASKNEMQQGWDFAVQVMGFGIAAHTGADYVGKVENAIKQLEDAINNHQSRNVPLDKLQGFMLEEMAGGTLNIDAAARGSHDQATVLHSTGKNSVDIQLKSGKAYSAKSYASEKETAVKQVAFDSETGKSGYYGQGRLVPSDKLSGAKAEAHRRALKNESNRPAVAEAYSEAESEMTDVIENKEGVSSKSIRRKELDQIAKESKKQSFKAEGHDITVENAIKPQYIMKQAAKAGLSAAAVTVIMQTAPEIFKAIDYLIKTGKLDMNQIKRIGTKAISSGAEGFLRGSVACTLQVLCEKGAFGPALKSINPTFLGVAVSLTLQTIKNSILVAVGKLEPREMGSALIDGVAISGGYLIGANIGGIIGQALGFELPVVGYLLGSLIGTAFSVVYNFGKKKLISFCVDTGFTCFGLVEQDYKLPEEILKEMGIDITPIMRAEVSRATISRTPVETDIQHTKYETINIKVLKRGIIGVNRVGYVLA